MKNQTPIPQSARAGMNRRRFLHSCTACSACMALMPLATVTACKKEKMNIRIVYSMHDIVQPGPDWPNVGFDFGPVMDLYTGILNKECPDFEFIPTMATGPEEAAKILESDQTSGVEGYIIFQMNCWNRVVQTIAESMKPVLYVDYKYAGSGGFLVYTSGFIRQETPNVGFAASSDVSDIIEAVRQFRIVKKGGTVQEFVAATGRIRRERTPAPGNLAVTPDDLRILTAAECVRRMKDSRILAVRDENTGPETSIMEIPLEYIPYSMVNDAWAAADREEARLVARQWSSEATDVIDVPFDTLENSAAMYLGMKEVLGKYGANAITINCLGGFYGGHINAYPCLGFHELNNQGLVGGCECDTRSTATMVALTTMTQGRPGYISDPVLDTSLRQIIYAHCVASNKVFGPDGPANPYTIMTHSEDRQGASVRSLLPTGYLTTSVQIAPDRKEILLHQAKAVSNDPDDRACRTKLCAEPIGDMEKLFTMWDRWGWHRVTFYGDLKEPVYALADAIGWSVVEEA